jgi:hypothetical protein
MDSETRKRWALMGSTVAGAVGGGMAATRLGAAFGLSLGPWGVAAGAVLGAIAGASAVSVVVGEVEFPAPRGRRLAFLPD